MDEAQKDNQTIKAESPPAKDEVSDYPNIVFEIGSHRLIGNEYGPYGWEEKVLARISQFQPEFIAWDGSNPVGSTDIHSQIIRSYYHEMNSHHLVPTIPKLFVVKGDSGEILTDSLYDLDPSSAQIGEKADSNLIRKMNFTNVAKALAPIFVSTNLALYAIRTRMDRRKFLGLITGAVGLATFTATPALLSTFASSKKDFEASHDLMDMAQKLNWSPFNENWWVSGRSALLIAKTQDSIDYKKDHTILERQLLWVLLITLLGILMNIFTTTPKEIKQFMDSLRNISQKLKKCIDIFVSQMIKLKKLTQTCLTV